MQAQLRARSSSTTLSIPDGPIITSDGGLDDLFITQELLSNSTNLTAHLSTTNVATIPRIQPLEQRSQVQIPPRRQHAATSNTWTSSEGEMPSDMDDDDRSAFITEYNHIAQRHGIRPMILADFEDPVDGSDFYGKPASWFSRKILRRTSSTQSIQAKLESRPGGPLKHKRSMSDLSLRLKSRHDKLKNKDLQELVRLCGSSLLYLPAEYATGSLAVPTCFRSTAQFLVQHAPITRGVFRVPGSYNTVALLYNHYCALDDGGDVISGTVRCPTLPEHIPCDAYDVASAFKRFLSGLPGGILGSLRLFDALISIQTQLDAQPERTRTKFSKVRARLIAIAIYTVKSQYRRDLICAVFGLLSLIGRTAETSKREDDHGRPLPTSDLMGYRPLGIVFGPLLVGELLEGYSTRIADPRSGLVLLPISPPKSKKERQKQAKNVEENALLTTYVDKIKVASGVAEMLIMHWREVVRHMKSLKIIKGLATSKSLGEIGNHRPILRPSASETFAIRKPPDWDRILPQNVDEDRSQSPTPRGRTNDLKLGTNMESIVRNRENSLQLHKSRMRKRPPSFQMLAGSLNLLSPTKEERSKEDNAQQLQNDAASTVGTPGSAHQMRREHERSSMSSRHSKKSRKSEPRETPGSGKLRKPRPPRRSGDSQLSISRTRSRPQKESSSIQVGEIVVEDTPETEKKKSMGHKIIEALPFKQISTLGSSRINQSANVQFEASAGKGTLARQTRRNADSEPYQKPPTAGSSRRITSRSLNVPNRSSRGLHAMPTDLVTTVSAEEDMASLASLARVIRNEHISPASLPLDQAEPSPARTSSPAAASPAGVLRAGHFDTKLWEQSKDNGGAITKSVRTFSVAKHVDQHVASVSTRASTTLPLKSSIQELVAKAQRPSSTTPKRVSEQSPSRRFGSPGPNVRNLAAKFDNAATSHNPFQDRHNSPFKPAQKAKSAPSPRKDTLLAQYTTNNSSPRSPKLVTVDKALISSHVKGSPSPTRKITVVPAKFALLGTDMRTENSTDVDQTEKHPTQSDLRVMSNPIKPITDSCARRTPLPPTMTQENVIRTLDGHDSYSSGQSDIVRPSSISSLTSNISSSATPAQINRNFEPADAYMETDVLDGSGENGPLTTSSPRVRFVKPGSPVSDESNQADPRSQHLITKDTTTPARSLSMTDSVVLGNTPLARRNSVLHTQIRDLQRRITAKEEEIKQLRQQLDARSHLDIGTLSEQLRDAKIEASSWKSRAEISEKQVDMLSRRIGRTTSMRSKRAASPSNSLRSNGRTSMASQHLHSSHLGLLDGADENDHCAVWGSEETTDTVLREYDTKKISIDSGTTVWIEDVSVTRSDT